MTERLYYRDCFLREFDARVVRVQPADAGRARVWLDQTAFYPTSGGQPNDLGTLEGVPVEDVFDEGGEVVHLLQRAPGTERVHGVIDWPRRFDHMQQHTDQHVLSAAFERLFNVPTVSFHLGRDLCTIDLATRSLGRRQAEGAEDLANQVLFEDRPVQIRFPTEAELAQAGLRRPPEETGEVRVIEIEDFDRCPCGGTHVARTGQIGLILCRGVEKVKQGVRVEFVCGGRALRAARSDFARLSEAARLLTTGARELPDIIRKQFDERRAAERQRQQLFEQLAAYEARALLAEAETLGDRRLVVRLLPDADSSYLRLLAARLVKEPGVQVLLANRAQPAALVFAQTPGLPADMNTLLREVLQQHGGKGGGSRDFAQGALPDSAHAEPALSTAAHCLRNLG
ncbi:MAG TPA: DHHA1 domain-containing protein [Candidatus Xenobia bacterium]|nr:DHHA1 domain-containing protein [Candidatus Xenobia bacterium]